MAAVVLKAGTCCIIIPEIFQGFAFPSKKAGGQQHSTHSPMEMIDQPGGSFSLATLSGTHVLVTQQKEMEPRGLTWVQTQHHSPGGGRLAPFFQEQSSQEMRASDFQVFNSLFGFLFHSFPSLVLGKLYGLAV